MLGNEEQGATAERSDRSRAYFIDSPVGMALIDFDGHIKDTNPALEELLGYRPGGMIGLPLRDLSYTETDEIDLDDLRELETEGRKRATAEAQLTRSDGSVLWAELSASMTQTLDGFMLTIQDITHRKNEHQAVSEERELLKRVVTSSADAICLVELSGTIIEWNPAAERLFGWSKEEIIGQPLSTLLPPEAQEQAGDILRREREGQIVEEIVPRLRKDGTVFEAELTASGVRDPQGSIIGYVGSYRDVTERLLVETASSAVASDLDPLGAFTRFAAVLKEVFPFAQLTLSVIEGDGYRRVVSVGNESGNFMRDEVVTLQGNPVKQVVDSGEPMIVQDTRTGGWPFDRSLAERSIGSYIIVPLLENERVFATINLGFTKIKVPTDQMLHLLTSIGQAVAQGVKNILLYEQQKESIEQLRTIDEMKNSFLQAVSHELRTPLTVVLGLTLTLQRHAGTLKETQQKEILRMLTSNARKLERLLTDLLDLDRLTRGVLEPHLRETRLDDLVHRMAKEVDMGERTLHIEADEVEILVDGAKVERIVENLLVNAIRHTPEGCRIWAKVERDPEGALLAVEDDGPGVEDESKEAIFELFRQGSEKPSIGTGVGLTLVTRFAQLHGGRAWVEDRAGGGASFRVFLPLKPPGSPSTDENGGQ